MSITFTDLGTYGSDARRAGRPPLPEALLVVRAGQGFVLFDAAEAADTHPHDLAASAALSVHADAASVAEAIDDWRAALAASQREGAA